VRPDDPNLPQLRQVARALGDLREACVFLGGAVVGLLLTDPLASGIRSTRDVDSVVNAGRGAYQKIEQALRARGFVPDPESNIICRWVHRESGTLFDLMPVEPEVLGFTNRWYRYAIETAQAVDLDGGLTIRLVGAVAFVATKLEAFAAPDRGAGDILGSHDLEDILTVVDGRAELATELAAAPADVREAVATAFASLLARPDFANVLPGLLAEPERAPVVLARMTSMVG
jgi:hypothetical protein